MNTSSAFSVPKRIGASLTICSKLADNYEAKPWQKKIVAQVSKDLRNSLDFIGVDWRKESSDTQKQVRLLDYACGPGTIARVSLSTSLSNT